MIVGFLARRDPPHRSDMAMTCDFSNRSHLFANAEAADWVTVLSIGGRELLPSAGVDRPLGVTAAVMRSISAGVVPGENTAFPFAKGEMDR
jgi:hypothetical protein